jgi:hypothetical protein
MPHKDEYDAEVEELLHLHRQQSEEEHKRLVRAMREALEQHEAAKATGGAPVVGTLAAQYWKAPFRYDPEGATIWDADGEHCRSANPAPSMKTSNQLSEDSGRTAGLAVAALVQPPMPLAHWLWMAPTAVAISPIGTIIFTRYLGLDFDGCLKLIGAQVIAFALLYVLSNGGE